MAPRAQIIVSTHFDDAVLSLAHVLQAAGPLATVVTVCGGPPPDGLPVSEWDAGCGFASGPEAARARVAEDAAACAVTGAPASAGSRGHAVRPAPGRRDLQAEIEPLLRGDCTLAPCRHRQPRPRARTRRAASARHDGQIYVDLPYAGALEVADANEVRLTPGDFERKLTAVRCHGSQLRRSSASADLLDPPGRSPRALRPSGTRRECHLAVPGGRPLANPPQRASCRCDCDDTLAEGEAVLWSERRTPPFMEAAIAVAVVLGVMGVAVANVIATPLLLAAAAGAVAARPARRGRATTSRTSC